MRKLRPKENGGSETPPAPPSPPFGATMLIRVGSPNWWGVGPQIFLLDRYWFLVSNIPRGNFLESTPSRGYMSIFGPTFENRGLTSKKWPFWAFFGPKTSKISKMVRNWPPQTHNTCFVALTILHPTVQEFWPNSTSMQRYSQNTSEKRAVLDQTRSKWPKNPKNRILPELGGEWAEMAGDIIWRPFDALSNGKRIGV